MSNFDKETVDHITKVQGYVREFCNMLVEQSERHDRSKFDPEERDTFIEYTPKLKASKIGTPEYESFRKEMGKALQHHYANNRHHPEHHEEGIEGMDLIDLTEMFFDWKASSERHDRGDINNSIAYCAERFGINQQLVKIFENTVKRFVWKK